MGARVNQRLDLAGGRHQQRRRQRGSERHRGHGHPALLRGERRQQRPRTAHDGNRAHYHLRLMQINREDGCGFALRELGRFLALAEAP